MRAKKVLSTLILLVAITTIQGQDYLYEIGAASGAIFYMGDANPNKLYHQSHFSGGVVFRYNPNMRWAVKGNLIVGTISGDIHLTDVTLPQQVSFKRQLYDLGGQVEFNFWNLGRGYSYLNTTPFSPYILAGIGLTFSPKKGETFWGLNIPLGLGIKYKITSRLNCGIEFSMRKTFGDHLDSPLMKDPQLIKSGWGKNTDWYSFSLVSLTYEFGRKKKECNNLQ